MGCLSQTSSLSGNAIRVSNSLDPDQDRRSVGPDLGPNCLQRIIVTASKERVKKFKSGNTIRVSSGLDPDQDPHSVGPDLGPNCL